MNKFWVQSVAVFLKCHKLHSMMATSNHFLQCRGTTLQYQRHLVQVVYYRTLPDANQHLWLHSSCSVPWHSSLAASHCCHQQCSMCHCQQLTHTGNLLSSALLGCSWGPAQTLLAHCQWVRGCDHIEPTNWDDEWAQTHFILSDIAMNDSWDFSPSFFLSLRYSRRIQFILCFAFAVLQNMLDSRLPVECVWGPVDPKRHLFNAAIFEVTDDNIQEKRSTSKH